MNRDTEHAGDLRERRGHIVPVADERDRSTATVAPSLAQREGIGERLARMLLVGQGIDDMKITARGSKCRRLFLSEGADDECPHPSLQVSCDVLKRLTCAFGQCAW